MLWSNYMLGRFAGTLFSVYYSLMSWPAQQCSISQTSNGLTKRTLVTSVISIGAISTAERQFGWFQMIGFSGRMLHYKFVMNGNPYKLKWNSIKYNQYRLSSIHGTKNCTEPSNECWATCKETWKWEGNAIVSNQLSIDNNVWNFHCKYWKTEEIVSVGSSNYKSTKRMEI